MTVNEIINGKAAQFPGLIPMIEIYLKGLNIDLDTRCVPHTLGCTALPFTPNCAPCDEVIMCTLFPVTDRTIPSIAQHLRLSASVRGHHMAILRTAIYASLSPFSPAPVHF